MCARSTFTSFSGANEELSPFGSASASRFAVLGVQFTTVFCPIPFVSTASSNRMALTGYRVHIILFRIEPLPRLSVQVGKYLDRAAFFWCRLGPTKITRASKLAITRAGLSSFSKTQGKWFSVDFQAEPTRQRLLYGPVLVCTRGALYAGVTSTAQE